jgi:hypothetical protein
MKKTFLVFFVFTSEVIEKQSDSTLNAVVFVKGFFQNY